MTLSMTVEQAVEVSGISRTKMYSLFKEGKLTPRKCGKRTLVLAEELQAFVKNLPTGGERDAA